MIETITMFAVKAFLLFLFIGSLVLIKQEWRIASTWTKIENIIVSIIFLTVFIILVVGA